MCHTRTVYDDDEEDDEEEEEEDDDDDDEEPEVEARPFKGGDGAGSSGQRSAGPPARRQKTQGGYSRNGDLTKGVKEFEGSKLQLTQLDEWGDMFKIYCAVKAGQHAGIYVCNHDDYDQCSMKFRIKKDTWNKKGYGNYERAKAEGLKMKAELQG